MANKLKVTWVRSGIAGKQEHCRTIRALGLHRLNESVIKDDTAPIRGMLFHVNHMVTVEEVNE